MFKQSECLYKSLHNIGSKKNLFPNVTSLGLFEVHDPDLLKGLKTPFPKLEWLNVDSFHDDDCYGARSKFGLSPVLSLF